MSELIVVLLLLYFLPGVIALLRRHQSAAGIVVLNLLLGWSVLGWIIALVWSLSAARRETVVVIREGRYF
jgi:ABC-type transport system involved in cytochrome c biogenesis permease component